MSRVQMFYAVLDKADAHQSHGSVEDVKYEKTDPRGMKIMASALSYNYSGLDELSINAISDVNLNIEAGKVILIAGANGSGKTTLVKLLAGMMKPAVGEILIDGEDLSCYDINSVRKAIAFAGQSEVIYPVSLRENIVMGLGFPSSMTLSELDSRVSEAIHLADASDIFNQRGYNTVVNPCSVNSFSIKEKPGTAALKALNRHSPHTPVALSRGEIQKIIAARTFFRARNGHNIGLVILDEATNSMDAIAERNALFRFKEVAQQRGQTLIIVTHRLSSLAEHADWILCMDKGRVSERGTHHELISANGRYSALYLAQTL